MPKVKLDRIDSHRSNRQLDQSHVENLAADIKRHGQLSRLVVIRNGNRLKCVAGNHRLAALRLAEFEEADCDILPDGTSEAEQLEISLAENHVRKDETFSETVARVDEIARLKECSFAQAAAAAGVKAAYASKCRMSEERLCPEAKKLCQENKDRLGISLVYTVATRARSEAEQIEMLESYLDARMTRDEIEKALKQPRTTQAKTIKLVLAVNDADVMLKIPAEATYDTITELLDAVKNRLLGHKERNTPVRFLPQVIDQTS